MEYAGKVGEFIISLIMPLRNIYLRGIGLIAWLPLVSVILFTQTIQFVDPHMLMLPYVIGVYSLRLGEKRRRNSIYLKDKDSRYVRDNNPMTERGIFCERIK